MFPFYTPWNRQKTSGFLTFSGSMEREHWPEMCYWDYRINYNETENENRHDINRTQPRHVSEYTKYKTCLSMIMVTPTLQEKCLRSYSGPYFPAFGLNIDRHILFLRIQNTDEYGHFYAVLSNIWCWIHEKVTQYWDWVEKNCFL